MSVQFSVVRFISVQQINLFELVDHQPVQDLCTEILPSSFRAYKLVEFVSHGWEGGAKCRQKRVAPEKALSYLSKLYNSGWITGLEYHKVFLTTYHLLKKHGYDMGGEAYYLVFSSSE